MKWIRRIIAAIAIVVLITSSYKIISYLKDSIQNKNKYEKITKEYHENDNKENNKSLKEINENIVAWIRLPGTNIDYPVVKGVDNSFYLDHDLEGKHSIHGSIFMDSRNKLEQDKNLVIYGHYMKDGTMFKDLVEYKDEDFFKENKTISVKTDEEEFQYQIFSVLLTEGDSGYIDVDFDSKETFLNYVDAIKEESLFTRDIAFEGDEEIITLSTCSYEFDDARTVIFGVKK